MAMHHIRRGQGRPLLLVHGIGGSWRSWSTVLDRLASVREVIAVDLPGHGETPRLAGPTTVPALADAVQGFLAEQALRDIDVVGSSMGARLVLELARRGHGGRVVSLDPGGFWRGWERPAFYLSIAASIRLVRALRPVLPAITASGLGRGLLLAQFSAHPARLPRDLVLTELSGYVASPVFDELLRSLAYGPEQQGMPKGSAGRRSRSAGDGVTASACPARPRGPKRCSRMRACIGSRIAAIFRIGTDPRKPPGSSSTPPVEAPTIRARLPDSQIVFHLS